MKTNSKSLIIFLAIGLIQGAAWEISLSKNWWSALAFILFLGSIIMLSDDGRNRIRLLLSSSLVSLLFAYLFSMLQQNKVYPGGSIGFAVGSFVIATYAAICMLQSYHQCQYKRPPYHVLFINTWTNICLILAALIFTGMVHIVLSVCASLMSLVGISFFQHLFSNFVFLKISTPLFFAIGLYLSFQWEKILSALRLLIFMFFKCLLPIITVFGWMYFLINITLIGIDSAFIQHTGYLTDTSLTALGFSLMSIIFINAVYQDGEAHEQSSKLFRWFVNALVILIALMTAYSLLIFITSSPKPILSPTRVDLLLLILLTGGYAGVYLYGIRKSAASWLDSLKEGNFVLSWLMMITSLLFILPFYGQWLPHIARSKQDIEAKQIQKQEHLRKISLYQHQFRSAKLSWSPLDTTNTATVLGYRFNKPLYACRSRQNKQWQLGVVIDHQCHYVTNNTIHHSEQFTTLSGPLTHIKWTNQNNVYLAPQNKLVRADAAAKKQTSICRTIWNNRIYIGKIMIPDEWTAKSPKCVFIVNDVVQQKEDVDLLSLSS